LGLKPSRMLLQVISAPCPLPSYLSISPRSRAASVRIGQNANRLMVHMLAAFAEHEREMISQRTKDGLRAAKARGTVLGRNGKVLGAENRSRADHHALSIVDQVVAIPSSDRQNVSALTLQMNSHQIPTMKGGRWHRQSVYRLLDRFLEARSDGAAVIDYVRVFGRSKWHALKNSFERSLSKNAASGI